MSLYSIANNLQSVDPVSLGGNVVAIMLRKVMLLGAMQRAALDKAKLYGTIPGYTVNPTNISLIAGVPITTRIQEGYAFSADITEFPVESGVFYQDHIILHPVRVDLIFEVSNWEKGDPKQSLELLEQMYTSRSPVDLITEHKKLSNMFLFTLNAENKMPEWGKLVFRASFQKINLVTLQATSIVSKEQVTATDNTQGPVSTKSLEPSVSNGVLSPTILADGSKKTLMNSLGGINNYPYGYQPGFAVYK